MSKGAESTSTIVDPKGVELDVKVYLLSMAVGLGVGILYALLQVKSPAPPLVALAGLLGMVIGERLVPWARGHAHLLRQFI